MIIVIEIKMDIKNQNYSRKMALSDETKIRDFKWKEIKTIAMDKNPELTNWFVSDEY